jgi:hypothetical protein
LVKFDIESDTRFRDSLSDLDVAASVEIVQCLFEIDQLHLTWRQFVETYGWEPMDWTGENTYPGPTKYIIFSSGVI